MIKKYKYLLVFILLFTSKSHALSPEYEKELYNGCYTNSKTYLGADALKYTASAQLIN
jgi:cephalosporin hydroxylase